MAHFQKPIRVGIDIRDLRIAKTGQKTVTEELCKQFAASNDGAFVFIFIDSAMPVYTGKVKWKLIIEHLRYHFWKQFVLPLKAWYKKCDIVFCVDYFVPYLHLNFKTVEVFHDAFFFEYPEHYNKLWLQLFHKMAMPAARRCSVIMTTTSYAKGRIAELTGIDRNKLAVIPLAPKTISEKKTLTSIPTHLQSIIHKKYVLHVGVMEKRKNLPALIKAFALLLKRTEDDLYLVLVGQGNGKLFSDDAVQVQQAIEDSGIGHRVICTGYLPDAEVDMVYQHASLYVFPSVNEGFGIPVLEAFKANIPVLVANNTSLPEVGGDAVLTFDPYDVEDICSKMQLVLSTPDVAEMLVTKGKERLLNFSWEKAATALKNEFRNIVQQR